VLLDFLIICVQSLVFIVALLTAFAYMTYAERRIVARMQWRLGPNRTGPFGLLQPAADGLKLLFKEQLMPRDARPFVFVLAPMISLVIALTAFAVIPVGYRSYTIFGKVFYPYIADLDVGVLFLLGISSLGVYGIILGGWASNNKYALLGAIRSSAQVISYELALGAALISPLMMVGSLSLRHVVAYQIEQPWWTQGGWLIFFQPLAFVLYCIAAVAEVNRAPFDLPEAEQELGAGYHTEYSGMKFAMFFMAEYVNMITVSAIATTVFLGGPGGIPLHFAGGGIIEKALNEGPWWFVLKVSCFMFVFIWLRATFPRFRYDQLMRIGWQLLLPIALLNLAITTIGVAFQWPPLAFTGAIVATVALLAMIGSASRRGHRDAVAV
jgi:NADH-quinone oxidoreductase subunit H